MDALNLFLYFFLNCDQDIHRNFRAEKSTCCTVNNIYVLLDTVHVYTKCSQHTFELFLSADQNRLSTANMVFCAFCTAKLQLDKINKANLL